MSDRLRIEGKLFLGAWTAYVIIAAIAGNLTIEVLAIRCGMAVVTAILIGLAYRRRPNGDYIVASGSDEASLEKRRARQWRILMWTLTGLVVVAFLVAR
jgi:hypothetical protein